MVRQLNILEEDEENSDNDQENIICYHKYDKLQQLARGRSSSRHDNTSFTAGDAAKTAAVAGSASVAVPTVATAGLAAAGFTGSGVAAGSMAAGIQAGIGNVVAGSLFATFQSIGATGGFAILGPLGLGAAAIGGLGYFLWNTKKKEERRREQTIERLRVTYNIGGTDLEYLCPECRQKLLKRILKKLPKNG